MADGKTKEMNGFGLARKQLLLMAMLFALGLPAAAQAAKFDELPVERWALLREAERYQLNIAEKYYREQNWKIALAEYEKFLSLYEKSEGAPFAQMKWSICQSHLRKLNTAIKDGYQSVIDYWPDSPEAVTSSYLIAKAYKDMGEVSLAKKAYGAVMTKHPQDLVTVLAKLDLIDMARVENDADRRLALLKDLVFNTLRKDQTVAPCVEASRQLANYSFETGAFLDGVKSLGTTYSEADLPRWVAWHLMNNLHNMPAPLQHLVNVPETKDRGTKLADAAVAWMKQQAPATFKDDAEKARARQIWVDIADIEWNARRLDAVGPVYDKMTTLFGVDDDLLGRIAGWQKGMNRRDEARKTYGRFKNAIEGQGHIAQSFREEAKYDQAIATFQDLLARDAEHTQRWLYVMAHTYREWGKYKEAIGTFRQCDNAPDNIQWMAWCHRQLKDYTEAVGLYRQMMGSHEPSAPWALLQIGYTQEQDGKQEAAIQTFQQVCKKFPKSPNASEAHAHLQNKYKITATLGGSKDE
jgi:tetratricopeptide (TPR) repeat protein